MNSTSSIEIPRTHTGVYRLLEILPGLITWSCLIGLPLLSIWFPFQVSILLLVYLLFWLYRSVRMMFRLIGGYRKYRSTIKEDWLKICESLPESLGWRSIHQVVIMAVYNEAEAILRASIESLAASQYPGDRIIFVLTVEERGGAEVLAAAKRLQKDFAPKFEHFMVVVHPKDLTGEVIGKGANITYAGREVQKYLDQQHIEYGKAIVTTLDSDNRVHPKYLAYLSFQYVNDPDPIHHSYQPLPMFFNNIWDVPLAIRSISIGSSFWQLMESTRPDRLRNFSAHAQSFAALVITDFWSVRTIVEDGHQFWRTYFRFNGRHDVIPLYVPIYQDAVLSPKGYMATYKEQYLQKRRWAWGVSDVPYVFTHLLDHPSIGIDGWVMGFRLLEGHISWAITSLMLAFVGWSPLWLNHSFRATVLAVNYPIFYERILQSATVGLVATFTISLLMLPPVPKRKKEMRASVVTEWLTAPFLLPLTNILFGSFPSIEAQTRLMFGRYLDYRVTEKAVARTDQESLIARH